MQTLCCLAQRLVEVEISIHHMWISVHHLLEAALLSCS
jgi:hypothetical protein